MNNVARAEVPNRMRSTRLNTAPATVATIDQTFEISIENINDEKCTRCWHRDSSVGQSKSHPEICLRCEENIDSSGEVRYFV